MELLSLVHCSWVAMNEVDDWTGIHHQFPKRSLGTGQVHRSVRQPYLGLRVRCKHLDINASRTIADEDDWSLEDSPRGIESILLLIVLFSEDVRVYGYYIRRPTVEALPVCVVQEDDYDLQL